MSQHVVSRTCERLQEKYNQRCACFHFLSSLLTPSRSETRALTRILPHRVLPAVCDVPFPDCIVKCSGNWISSSASSAFHRSSFYKHRAHIAVLPLLLSPPLSRWSESCHDRGRRIQKLEIIMGQNSGIMTGRDSELTRTGMNGPASNQPQPYSPNPLLVSHEIFPKAGYSAVYILSISTRQGTAGLLLRRRLWQRQGADRTESGISELPS
jgi:hypothetical protein